jgi:2-polyprenyl-3-methyl-5-hydroxy-6-metoxy-1,4-benzoquinol methylase
MDNEDEYSRLKKVAGWYQPSANRMESYLINRRIQVMLPFVEGPRVLELGCSEGIMTKFLAQKFSRLTVIDGSKKYIDNVRASIKNETVKFSVSLFEKFDTQERFDDIIMANILEHVEDPVLILKKAGEWLDGGGRIHIMVPNARSLHRRLGQKMGIIEDVASPSENDKKIGHRRVYTQETLESDIKKSGLAVVAKTGIFLKPLSHSQLMDSDAKLLDALFEIGKELPDYCSTIYFVCGKKQ